MALINCPECGIEVSDRADKCMKCAYPLNKIGSKIFVDEPNKLTNSSSSPSKIFILAIVLIIIVGAYFIYEKNERDNLRAWREYRDRMDPDATGKGYLEYSEWKKSN